MLGSSLSSPRFARSNGRTSLWRAQSKIRSERVGGEPYRWSARRACRWQSRAAHRPPGRQSIHRRGTPHRVPSSRSVRKKSPTSTWRRSMSSTRKTSSSANACNLLAEAAAAAAAGAAQCEAAAAAAAAAAQCEPVEAVAAAAARCEPGEAAAVEAVAAAAPPAWCGRAGAGSGSASGKREAGGRLRARLPLSSKLCYRDLVRAGTSSFEAHFVRTSGRRCAY